MQMLNVDEKFARSELTLDTLVSRKQKEIILKPMCQAKGNYESLVLSRPNL